MTLEIWFALAAATLVLVFIPGPTTLLVVSYALGQGWRTAFPMAAGVALGDVTAMTVSMLGVGTLLMASATAFTVLKWVGAVCLVWLGIRLWRSGGSLRAAPRKDRASAARLLGHAWMVTALNPKSITFYVAFLPQFLDPEAGFLTQMLIIEATVVVPASCIVLVYAALAARAGLFVRNPRAVIAINRVGGSLLIGTGVAAVAVRPAQS